MQHNLLFEQDLILPNLLLHDEVPSPLRNFIKYISHIKKYIFAIEGQ